TIHREVGMCPVIIHSSVILLEIAVVVHISVEMVLTIITMGTGVTKTGIVVEISM
ncbi:hypothetical protein RYX36_013867, partial [Vicia faba]